MVVGYAMSQIERITTPKKSARGWGTVSVVTDGVGEGVGGQIVAPPHEGQWTWTHGLSLGVSSCAWQFVRRIHRVVMDSVSCTAYSQGLD